MRKLNFLLILLIFSTASLAANEPLLLEQNWTDNDREFFYFADQGSRLLPYDYFLYLEQANSTELLRSDKNMQRLGFIPAPPSNDNPDGLAIGLSRNGDAMGPTCAACHTQQISYQNQLIRIDGGQGQIDLPALLQDITQSLKATLDNPEKYARFAQHLLGKNPSDKTHTTLKADLATEQQHRLDYAHRNHSDTPYGYSRTDAFGAILNTGLFLTGVEGNFNQPNAGTSFPYIWDTPQHDYVEWNGSQSNSGVGALARNIGEVIGVFGHVTPDTTHWLGFIDGGYPSSVNASNLRKLEMKVAALHSPEWPAIFPEIDHVLAAQGRGLYQTHCIECHLDIKRADPHRQIKVRMSTLDEIKTDPLMANNTIEHKGETGILEGKPRYYFAGDLLGATAPAIHIVNNVMIGVLKNNPLQAWLAKRDAKSLGHPDVVHPPKYVNGNIIEQGKEVSDYALLAYKARPLNGIWTSAPFLHNGSVPNLYQLLLPAAQRDTQFHIGNWEFNPVTVGFATQPSTHSFLFDTTLLGNSNVGHEYGTGHYADKPSLTEDERWALIEYLKML